MIKASEEDFRNTNKELTKVIFGDKELVKMDELLDLVSSIKEELYHFEFNMFDSCEDDTISVDDFLKSIVSCISGRKRKHYLRRIKTVAKNIGEEGRVSFKQYLAF